MPHLAPPIWAPGINLGHPLAQGLALALPMWEGDGTTASDYSANGNHGTLTNMDAGDFVAWDQGFALDFDGSNDRVTVSYSKSIDLTASFSMSCWIRPTSVTGVRGVLSKYGSDVALFEAYRLALNGAKLRLQIGDGASTQMTYDSTASVVSINTWQQIGVVHNAVANTNTLYHNGVAAAGGYISGSGAVDAASVMQAFRVGGTPAASQFFVGRIANVLVHNRALSAAEVAADYADPWAIYRPPVRLPLWVAATSAGAGAVSGALSEGAKAGDTVQVEADLLAAVTEGADAGDAWAVALSGLSAVTDGAKAGDALAGVLSALASISEGSLAGDELTAIVGALAVVSEGAEAGDQVSALATLLAAVSEGAKAGDALSVIGSFLAAATEGALAGDAYSATIVSGLIAAAISEGTDAGDTFANNLTALALYSERILAGDTATAILSARATLTEGVLAGDTYTAVVAGLATAVARLALTGTDTSRLALWGTSATRLGLVGTDSSNLTLRGSR